MPQLSVTQQSDGRSRGGSHVCESLSGRTLAGKTADGRLSGVRFQEREGERISWWCAAAFGGS